VYDIAGQIQDWWRTGRPVALARTVSVEGMSSRWAYEAAASCDQVSVGRVLGGAADAQLAEILRDATAGVPAARIHELSVDDAQAAAAGLSCGGRGQVLVQPARDVPEEAWTALAQREPVCLVTELEGGHLGRTRWFTVPGANHQGPDAKDGADLAIERWFGRGMTATAIMDSAAGQPLLVNAFWPVTRLVIIGDGLLAEALSRTAELLDWQPETVNEVDAAIGAVSSLANGDAVIVLTHSRDVDGPVLSAALGSRAGYVGALGSRRTQAARATWLAEHGVASDAMRRIHGPAGLDIGARTPGEIALSIAAEVVSVRTGAGGQALRDRSGPIHTDGLNTPPARYGASQDV